MLQTAKSQYVQHDCGGLKALTRQQAQHVSLDAECLQQTA
jgi:hypothetical protein